MSSSAILPTANITHIFWWCARTNLIGCWIIVFFSNKKKIVEKLNFYSGLHESFVRRLLGRFHQLKLNFKKIESICRSKWSCHFQRQFWEKTIDVISCARVSGDDCCLVTPSVVGSFISDGFLLGEPFWLLLMDLFFLPEEEEGLSGHWLPWQRTCVDCRWVNGQMTAFKWVLLGLALVVYETQQLAMTRLIFLV